MSQRMQMGPFVDTALLPCSVEGPLERGDMDRLILVIGGVFASTRDARGEDPA